MQGIFRYTLAHLVVLGHLWKNVWETPKAHPGVYAVFAFYLLSGYLMALTLTRTYAFDVRGTARFFGNRALRIYPPYLVLVACTSLVLLYAPPKVLGINPFIRLPDTGLGWIHNIGIFGLGSDFFHVSGVEVHRLVPPAWSLDVELCFYIAMGALLGRHRKVSIVWLLASAGYTVQLLVADGFWADRYSPAAAASLPFSIGACIYHWRVPLLRGQRMVVEGMAVALRRLGVTSAVDRLLEWQALALGVLFLLHAIFAEALWGHPMYAGFYVSLAIAAYLLVCLSSLDRARLPARLVQVDRFLGDLSYSVFLCHWLVALITTWIFFGSRPAGNSTLFWSSLVGVNVLAYLIHVSVERPVERMRDAVRPRGKTL